MLNYENDVYYDVYSKNKLTAEEIRQFKEYENLSDEEIEKIANKIFDVAIVAIRSIS